MADKTISFETTTRETRFWDVETESCAVSNEKKEGIASMIVVVLYVPGHARILEYRLKV